MISLKFRLAFCGLIAISTLRGQPGSLPALNLRDLDGRTLTWEMLLGRGPVLVDFWALWCAPCLKALPHLNELQQQYQEQGLTVLLVNIDSENSRSKVRRYIRSRNYRFTVAHDPTQELLRRMSGRTLPYTLLVSTTGRITYRHTGFMPGDDQRLAEEVAALIPYSPTDSLETQQQPE